jgi:phosphotransferase system enzyme I (PtsI)
MNVFVGKTVYPGAAVGKAAIASYVKCKHDGLYDASAQKERYFKAKGLVKKDLVSLCANEFSNDVYDIIKSYILILEDEEYDSFVSTILEVERSSAECAVKKASEHFAAQLKKSGDEYIKGRVSDVYDLSDRIRTTLKEISEPESVQKEEGPVILVSEYMSVTEIIKRGKENIAGLISTKNTLHSHASIVARSLGIPAIIVNEIEDISTLEGSSILIDGYEGKVYINPDEETIKEKLSQSAEAVSYDADIKVYANVQSAEDVAEAIKNGADGIGLFRTEFIYLGKDNFPTEEDQFEIYKAAAINAAGKDIVLRTADLGDDKTPAYLETNGLRAIKLCLSMPDMFKTQLRALLRASNYGNISIMFPMISSMDEVAEVKKILDEVKAGLRDKNIAFNDSIKTGAMIETPAAVEISDTLAKEFDFFSVGSNDLTQFTLGVDRLNSEEEKFYNQKDPKVIELIKTTVNAAHRAGITVGICGELASDVSFMRELKEIGFDYISVSVPVLERIKCK